MCTTNCADCLVIPPIHRSLYYQSPFFPLFLGHNILEGHRALGELELSASRYTRLSWWGDIIHLLGRAPPKNGGERLISRPKEMQGAVDPNACSALEIFCLLADMGRKALTAAAPSFKEFGEVLLLFLLF